MKNLGITLSIIISILFFGNAQNNLSKRLQSKNMKNIDCQNISFNSLELIANKLKQNEMDSVEIVTNE